MGDTVEDVRAAMKEAERKMNLHYGRGVRSQRLGNYHEDRFRELRRQLQEMELQEIGP